eukprot:SM010130S09154  [mRNA]  locus=s10130:153:467:+ [translate_table: standard]
MAVATCGPIPSAQAVSAREQLTEEQLSPPALETQGAPALPPPPLMKGPQRCTRSFPRILCPLGAMLALMILCVRLPWQKGAAATTRRAAAAPTIPISRAVHTRPA